MSNPDLLIPPKLIEVLKTQKYHLVGRHSAVKRCRWLYEALLHNRTCYKQKFYGIETHRCIQMTPSVIFCTLTCSFCWRVQTGDSTVQWKERSLTDWDDPNYIVTKCIEEHQKILSGYKGNLKVDSESYTEAMRPKHVAISLSGEPTLYPPLGELIRGFHRNGFTTFLVSNGTNPKALSTLNEEPTQLYVSVSAYNQKLFTKLCRPKIPDAWKKLEETLSLLPSLSCPTVVRLTLARHLNLDHAERYAKLLRKASPTYIEPKAYMYVGFSRFRLGFENMPTHKEISVFASHLAQEMNYNVLDESDSSRVVLLSRLEKPFKLSAN